MESKESVNRVVAEVSRLVSEMAGIQLGSKQSFMVESRLKSRLMKLRLASFTDYLAHLKANPEVETQALLSLMTTHHTYFFREFPHFEFLLNKALGPMIEAARGRADKTIRVWSAACSRGQEVYSLAMFLRFHLSQMAPDLRFEIWGTDVDPESVAHAKNGVYKVDELKQSPAMYLENNWVRGKGHVADFSKVKESLKAHCRFGTLNLLKCRSALQGLTFDLIFCRNVFIYFDQGQIQDITKTFLDHLDPSGFLVLGVSESLHGLNLQVQSVGPSVYRKPGVKSVSAPVAKAPEKKVLDVLCVDDSPSILALLKKILTTENGFRVKATAANGARALEIMKSQSFDLVTLDLHMPELDGIGFLKSNERGSTPVVVVSSVNRDDLTIAKKAVELGARDYVEKPSLQNLAQAGDEIRSKLKTVFAASSSISSRVTASPVAVKGAAKEKTRVLIVDDSKTIRQLLKQIIEQDPEMEVVGLAERPSQVDELIRQTKPHVITLDIHMPEMDGVTLLKKIFPKYRLPCVMISSISSEEGPAVLNALEAGAVDYIQKPEGGKLNETASHIRDRLKAAASARLRTRISARKATANANFQTGSLVVMGASTGGTEALRTVLESMPSQIPPILIVQHIPAVFSAAFAKRLNDLLPFDVREARDGDEVKPNQVLIAPGGKQMGLRALKDKLVVTVTDVAPVNRHKPSVDYLFKSVREAQIRNVVGVLLTGMGADGAQELLGLRKAGARTIAQDEASSVVYGMPKAAAQIGAAESIASLEDVGRKVIEFCTVSQAGANQKKVG